ncbi:hypothetical protein [Winogradskyella luteola]|uniref:Uncharacterized protein n=1 Tax=Winogradskyella luteola TaxID=2828330 RepID=A0A9X1JPK6_9FLAO|nr:hypothetical protein [Winogradskyella luteola]MBV7268809.1 hypothetical protein [Winogradskyella luteola]
MMTIKKSTENLYSIFSKYTIEGNLRARSCDCCVSDEEIKQLLSKPMRKLTENDLYHFMTSATTTFGCINDYKHFLPRILELMQNTEVVNDFTTFEKLNYNKWKTWDTNEINAIVNYFEALLINALDKNSKNINDFILLNLEYNKFEKLSDILTKSNSKKLIYEIVEGEINGYFYKVDDRLLRFYSSKKMLDKVEALFFETNDKELANRVSIAYSLLESRRAST